MKSVFKPAFEFHRPTFWNWEWPAEAVSKDLERAAFNPPCDIREGDNEYLVSLDVPGMRKEDVTIEASDGVLTISGERKNEHMEEKGKAHLVERFRGTFSRSFTLPTGTDVHQIRASYQDGVLKLLVPKPSGTLRQQIRVGDELPSRAKGPLTQH